MTVSTSSAASLNSGSARACNDPSPTADRSGQAGTAGAAYRALHAIGGIDVEVAEPINDPDYPDAGFGYEPFYIDAGWQHLGGHTTLRYARTRATPGATDHDR